MNEAILAYRAWQSLNNYLYKLMINYEIKDGQRWDDEYCKQLAGEISSEHDSLIPVLEWLEKKFE